MEVTTPTDSKPALARAQWPGYLLAIAAVLVTLWLRMLLTPWVGERPVLILFIIPILLSAYVGGLRVGLVSTALVGLETAYYVMPPLHSFAFERPVDFAQWLLLVLIGIVISIVMEELQRARRGLGVLDNRYLSTERKIQLGFGIALVCLAVISVASYLSMTQLNQHSALAAHSKDVINRLNSLLTIATDAETAQRGYLITGDEDYLEPFRQASRRVDSELQQLRAEIADNPAQVRLFEELAPLLARRLAVCSEIIELRRNSGFSAAQAEMQKDIGKQLHDRLRNLILEMTNADEKLLAAREAQARKSSRVTQAIILGGGVLAFGFVGLALFVVRRDFAGRQRAETELHEANEQLEARVVQRTAQLELAVESVRLNERRFRALIEHSGDSIALIDAHNKILYLSPSVASVEGYTADELQGHSGIENTHPEDLPYIEQSVRQLLADPGKPLPVLWRRRHKHGHWIWLEGTATNMLNDPAVGAIVTNYRDVTERVAANSKLQSQFQRLALLSQITRAIVERHDIGSIFQVVIRTLEAELPIDFGCVCLYDATANRLTVSRVGVRSAALAMELALTEQSSVAIDENGLSQCVRGSLVYEPDIREVQFPFPQRLVSGGLNSMVAAPLISESKVFGILVAARRQAASFSSGECEFLRQLSEHVALAAHQAQLYTSLQNAYADLRQTQQAVMQQERLRVLGQMASGIAHDINNAISPVTLYTESLLEQEKTLSDRARSYLQTIQQAIGDVAETVKRMREFYRQREPQVAFKPMDLNLLVPQVVELTRARWLDIPQQRGIDIQLRTELAAELPSIIGAESEIREALTNLIFNAVDAMPHGGTLTLRTKVERSSGSKDGSAGVNGDYVQVEVVDTGIGMDEETQRHCLELFFTTKGERGTGLGLAMVYGTAQRHNAELQIESAVGKGTCMRLSFVATTVAAPAPPISTYRVPKNLRMLIVDDDPILLKSLSDTLTSDGYRIVTASGGQEGIDAFVAAQNKGEIFDVVMTDLGMPFVDGRKVAAAIKAASPSTPVIMLTGWGQRLAAEGELPSHVDRVLSKPPRLRELRQALAELFTDA